ncbi:MAG: BON domain-containing protein [Planctomycetes bacterium]|nr:BON domain-containing protein [Planctomycetota bacterium]
MSSRRNADQQLIATLRRSLEEAGYSPLRGVRVAASDGCVTLSGRVPTWYMKQVAQEIALGADGVTALANDLEVL